nr:hypothetical protein BHI3_06560 [Bacteriovorax sp. HI3]
MLKIMSYIVFTSLITTQVYSATSPSCPGEQGFFYTNDRVRNPKQGGFVSNEAYVDDSHDVFIGPQAAVCGSSEILGRARIMGNAIVINSKIIDQASIKENAIVNSARLSDDAEVSGNARVNGPEVIIRGKARVYGNAIISGDAIIEGNAEVAGFAKISTGVISSGVLKPSKSDEEINDDLRRKTEQENNLKKQRENDQKILSEKFLTIYENYFNNNKFKQMTYSQTSLFINEIKNLTNAFFNKYIQKDIQTLLEKMQQREMVLTSTQKNEIDATIAKLNIDISFLYNLLQKGAYLYESFEYFGFKNLALEIEHIRLQSFIYSRTYIGKRGNETGLSAIEAEYKIKDSMVKYQNQTSQW